MFGIWERDPDFQKFCVSKMSAKGEIRSKNGTKLGVRRSGNGETKKEGLIGEWASLQGPLIWP